MSFIIMQRIRAFRVALDAGDLDDATVQLHRLPDAAKPAARAELAKLKIAERGETGSSGGRSHETGGGRS